MVDQNPLFPRSMFQFSYVPQITEITKVEKKGTKRLLGVRTLRVRANLFHRGLFFCLLGVRALWCSVYRGKTCTHHRFFFSSLFSGLEFGAIIA